MTKFAKKIVLIFCSFFFVICLSIGGLLGLNTNKNVTAKAATEVKFSRLSLNAYFSDPVKITDLEFVSADGSTVIDFGHQDSNYASTATGIYWKAAGDDTKHYFEYVWGINHNALRFMNFGEFPPAGATVTIEEGTTIGEYVLPELTFKVIEDATNTPLLTKWVMFANYLGISHNMENCAGSSHASRLSLGLQFDKPLAGSKNQNLFSGNSLNIYLDGVKLINGNFSPRVLEYISDNTVMELLFKNGIGSAGTYAEGVQLQNGTKLEIKDSVVNGYKLPDITLYFNGATWQDTDPRPLANYLGISHNMENCAGSSYASRLSLGLKFDKELAAAKDQNLFDGGNTLNIYLDGVALANGNFSPRVLEYISDNTVMELLFKNGIGSAGTYAAGVQLQNGTKLEIKDSVVNGYKLPDITLYFNGATWQENDPNDTTPAPVVETASFVELKDGGVFGEASSYGVYLKFDRPLRPTGDSHGYGTANQSGELGAKLTFNGATLTPFGNVNFYVNYVCKTDGADSPYLEIFFVNGFEAEIKHNDVLHIPEGTLFGEVKLAEVTLYYNETESKWQTEPAPVVETASFVELKDGGAFGSPHYGVYVKFDKPLRPTLDQYGTANTSGDLAATLTWNGNKISPYNNVNLWVNYVCTEDGADSPYLEILFANESYEQLKHGDVLHIPEGTLFGEVKLAEVTLYYNATESKWQTTKPTPVVSGFEAVEGASVRIDRENGGLRFETHIEKATYDNLVATYGKNNIQLGTYILPAAWLELSGKSLHDYVITYTAENGYYLDISTWNSEQEGHGFANGNAAGEITDGKSYYKYYGTIAKVKYENYLESFIGVGYLWVTDKDGETYLYLTHDGSWSRNVYEIAKEAYKDTANVSNDKMYGVTPYFDKVIAITTDGSAENALVYDIDSVLSARPSYSYTKPTDYTVTVADGVITIVSTSNTVYNVMINGAKAGVMAANATAYADYYAVIPELYATTAEASAINFGFAEPNRDLYSQGNEGFNSMFNGETNPYSTSSNIAEVTAEFDGNSARIWFQTADLCWNSSNSTELVLDESCLATLKRVIANFRAQGVTNISLMSGVANTKTTKNFYSGGEWYNHADATGKTLDGMALSLVVLPNEEDYGAFIALQKEYFKQLALEVGNTVTAIEVLNEMEGASNYRFHYENGYLPDISFVAQAAMDICKAASDGVKEAGKNIKIAMPALMTVSELKSGNNVLRYESKAFAEAEYAYIKSVGGNPDDYFQIINMHPYVTLSSDTSTTNYLYYENDGLTLQTPAQIQERWISYMNTMRAVFVANGDAEKPVWITEFGLADYNDSCVDPIGTNKWSDYKNNKLLRQAQVYQSIYDAMVALPYLDTVLFFRLGDYPHAGDHNYVNCGEATYGVIDKNGSLKEFGKYLYAIANGVNVFTDQNYTSLKSTDKLGTINGKTVDELATNVNNIY